MKPATEARNPASSDLDLLDTAEILRVINREDQSVAQAVAGVIPQLARAVDAAVARLGAGGRVFYVGAGTSGRLGVLDASEIPPTFGAPAELFQAVIAGGYAACHAATEASEDDAEQGARDLQARGASSADVVLGIAASGRTPYTRGAVEWARRAGALTIALCCTPDAPLAPAADIAVVPVVGPEVLAGSTRMKAGTAQKLVLNMFSTALMVRLGHVYSNWMVNVQMTNAKLARRGLGILVEASGRGEDECRAALEAAGGDLKAALVMLVARVPADAARRRLEASAGNVRAALAALRGS
jgi:N-acetylmuramic acid 6-phosphate etherase